jgi:hypothetical protein
MTAGQICGDSFCGLTDCDTVLCGIGDSGEETAIILGVYRIMHMCELPRVCVEVMGNPQTSGTSPKTRLPLLVARCIGISTTSQQMIFLILHH